VVFLLFLLSVCLSESLISLTIKLQEYKILSFCLSLSSIIHSSGDGDSDKISIGKTHARTHASTRARPHIPRDRHSCARRDTDIKMDR